MLSRVYEKVDSAIMDIANKAVRGYNWTTGGTKADLARTLLFGVALTFPLAGYFEYNRDYNPLIGGTVMTLSVAFILNRSNKNIEKKEVEAAERGIKDYDTESRKQHVKETGYIVGSLDATMTAGRLVRAGINFEHEKVDGLVGSGFTSLALFLWSSSLIVMSAENLPPRKNCISRGIDSLKEWWAESSTPPS